MRRLTYFGAAVVCALTVSASPATAHNAGCVKTGNDEVVTVGSGKEGPFVSANNPHFHFGTENDGENYGRLDLQPGDGDQYGARFAAVHSPAVNPPGRCT